MTNKRDKQNIRQVNTAMVLNVLYRNGSQMSRPVLADRVGLSKVTIASIIRNLNQTGFTTDAGMGLPDFRGGRKPVLVALNKENKRVICARLEQDHVEMLLSDITGRELSRLRSRGGRPGHPSEMAAMIRELMANGGCRSDAVLGLMLARNHHDRLETEANARDDLELSRLLSFPVRETSLAKARVFGQHWYNEDYENPPDFFYLDLGPSLEAITSRKGVLIDRLPGFGSICLSHPPYGSENSEAPTAESLLSSPALLRKAAENHGRRLDLPELIALAQSGDDRTRDLFQQYGYQLGCLLALAVNTTSLCRLVVGGPMIKAWPFFESSLQPALGRRTHPDFSGKVSVSPLRLDLDDGLLGALALALDQWIYQTGLLRQE